MLLIKLSFPTMTGMIIYSMFSLIDTFFVAKLGAASLAAFTLTIPVQILITSMASATGVGVTSLIARTLGKGDIRMANNIAWHGIVISIAYGIFFVILGIKYIDDLLIFFGCTPETFVLSKRYLNIILIGCIFTFLPMMLGNIVQGEGNTLLPMLVVLTGIALNVILDPLFIFGWGIIRPMGLNGAAIATVLSEIIAGLLLINLILHKKNFLTWSLSHFSPSVKVLVGIYKVGFPTMVMELAGVVIMVILNRLLAVYSYTAIAAVGIFLKVRSLIYMPVAGLAQGTMPIAAFAYGAGSMDRVKETIVKASVIALAIMAAAWFALQFHTVWIVDFFSNDPALTVMGSTCMRMATLALPLMGPIVILNTVLQALGKGTTAMWFSLVRQIGLLLPLLIVLPKIFSLNGIWLSFSVTEFLSALIAVYYMVALWRELQTRRKSSMFILLKVSYSLQRMMAWLRWSSLFL